MTKDRKNNSVSFNLLDDFELSLLEHAEKVSPRTGRKRSFSKYVKKLIEMDMQREQQTLQNQPIIHTPQINQVEDNQFTPNELKDKGAISTLL